MKPYKYIIYIFVIATGILTSCRNPDLEIDEFKISRWNTEPYVDSISFSGTFSFVGKVNGIQLHYDTDSTMQYYKPVSTIIDGNEFHTTVNGLKPNTRYYYRYAVDLGTAKEYWTETKDVNTTSGKLTVVINKTEIEISDSYNIRVTCEVKLNGGSDVIEKGICWTTGGSSEPTIHNQSYPSEWPQNLYSDCVISNISPDSIYYIRAYAINQNETGYSQTDTVRLLKPEVTTDSVKVSHLTTATIFGTMKSLHPAEKRGFCFSVTEHQPSLQNADSITDPVFNPIPGTYFLTIENLTPGKRYYVRAFAKNRAGTNYGETLSFEIKHANVTTEPVSNIEVTSVKCHGTINYSKSQSGKQCGFFWGKNQGNTYADNNLGATFTMEIPEEGGSFEQTISDLTSGTLYFVRAYSCINGVYDYGDAVSFTTLSKPIVETSSAEPQSADRIHCKGHIKSGLPIKEYGFVYSTFDGISQTVHTEPSNFTTGSYEMDITGLKPDTRYIIKAYARNEAGTDYGNIVETTTKPLIETRVYVPININETSATLRGEIFINGNCDTLNLQKKGFMVINTNDNTIHEYSLDGIQNGYFDMTVDDLVKNTEYDVFVFIKRKFNSHLFFPSDTIRFKTICLPTVRTKNTTSPASGAVSSGGVIEACEGNIIREWGLCWSSVDSLPDINSPNILKNPHDESPDPNKIEFTTSINGLASGATYYFRAYAKTDAGDNYGEPKKVIVL